MSEIKPALTPEEWTEWGINTDSTQGFQAFKNDSSVTDLIVEGQWIGPTHCHALAALALYGHPFGFTREDVRLLEEWRSGLMTANYGRGRGSPVERQLASLADRIKALLPPEAP